MTKTKITRRQVEDAASRCAAGGYEKRSFVRIRGMIVELLGERVQQRSTCRARRGDRFLVGRNWVKSRGWAKSFDFKENQIEEVVSSWEVALLETEMDLRRAARAERVTAHTRGDRP